MKKNLLYLLSFIFIGLSTASCSDDDDDTILIDDSSCLIINQGNFTERNSSLSYYNETDSVISNEVFIKANGRRLAAFAESGASNGTLGIVICNSPDKLEIIDIKTAKTVTNPIISAQLVNPRYAVMTDKYAYVTCWGGRVIIDGWWDEAHTIEKWTFPDSYIARVDLATYKVVDTTACGNDVEGIVIFGNKIYVAVVDGVEAYNLSDMSKVGAVKHSSFGKAAKYLAVDKNGKMWYSVYEGGFALVNMSTMTIEKEIPHTKAQSYFVMNKAKDKLIFFTNESENWVVTKSNVYALDVNSQTVNTKPIYEGNHLNGVGVNPKTGKLYTAEVYGYTENSLLKIMDEDGKNIKEMEVGVTASRFVFF